MFLIYKDLCSSIRFIKNNNLDIDKKYHFNCYIININFAIQYLFEKKYLKVIKLLLTDKRVEI